MPREDYLRVTEVLYPFSGLQNVNPDVLQKAAQRGTKVHQICESIAAGWGEIGVTDETWGYVESFKHWWSKGHEVASMEERFWHDGFHFTGQVDFIIKRDDGFDIS